MGYTEASVLTGGLSNNVHWATYSVLCGGYLNSIGKVDGGGAPVSCAVLGGANNEISDGQFGVILGGESNRVAASYALTGGRRAKALHQGAFVWGDSTDDDVESSSENEVTMRASGGVRFFSSADLSTGVTLAPGDGSWSSVSDRNAKRDFQSVDVKAVLDKVAALPMSTWSYKTQDAGVRHLGPMAQDFTAAFNLGADDKRISAIDADGVALAAIQGLNEKLSEALIVKDSQLADLREDNANLQVRLAALEKIVAELASQRSAH